MVRIEGLNEIENKSLEMHDINKTQTDRYHKEGIKRNKTREKAAKGPSTGMRHRLI